MSQYLVLIYESEAAYANADEQLFKQIMADHNEFGAKHAAAIKGGEALQPSAATTSIRGSVVTDGPFAETKEMLGGYYLIEAADLDEALAIAKDVPARFGGVEVRPIMTFE
jgi:hypothetical protein